MKWLGPSVFVFMLIAATLCITMVLQSSRAASFWEEKGDARSVSQGNATRTAAEQETTYREKTTVAPARESSAGFTSDASGHVDASARTNLSQDAPLVAVEHAPLAVTEPIRINFQPAGTDTPHGYLADTGQPFANRNNGWHYGWIDMPATEARQRGVHADIRYDTFIHLTKGPSRVYPGKNAPNVAGGSDGYASILSRGLF